MRLTLRTLLAYLDGVLDRQDSETIRTKVAESENAKQLVARIEEVTARRAIEPLRVDARTHSGDANAMADYLDGTMPPEQVAQHEKGCLDSDALLAEAAQSHQILSRVIREPAKVTERFRARLTRRTLEELERLAPQVESETSTQYRQDEAHASRRSLPANESPQHGPRVSESGLGDLPVLKPREVRQTIGNPQSPRFLDKAHDQGMLRSESEAETSIQPLPQSPASPSSAGTRRAPLIAALASVALLIALVALAIRGDLGRWLQPRDGSIADRSTADATASDSAILELAAAENQNQVSSNHAPEPITLALPSNSPSVTASPVSNSSSASRVSPLGTSSGAVVEAVPASTPLLEPPTDATAARPVNDSGLPSSVLPSVPVPAVAPALTWSSNDTAGLALYFGPADSDWRLLSHSVGLETGGFVQSMPVDRAQLTTNTLLQIELIGATQVALASDQPRGNQATAGLELMYGRLTISHPQPNQRCVLIIGTSRWTLDLIEAGSIVAVERRPWNLPNENWSVGTADVDRPKHEIVQVIVSQGQVNVSDDSTTKTLSAPRALVWFDGESLGEGRYEAAPSWLVQSEAMTTSARAATLAAIDTNLDPVTSWTVLLNHERPDIRTTAMECLTELGLYEGAWEMMSSESLPALWRRRLSASIQEQLRRGEGRALRFKEAAPDPEFGQLALDLWSTPSAEVLEAGGGARLVELLDHTELMIRFLAFEQLLSITGSTELYVPEADRGRRMRGLMAWQQRLADQGIVYAQPPQLPVLLTSE